ncbi:peptidase inhibitor family I36 protein [Bacillus sp. ME78]|uniref:peptidase inhibitor family I36 protein n=1 Tax=Bacillus sp. ME78 TaxID=2744261 RepID=UPI0016032934|nr:peptidase inhibitor family I36 protein [Bacillus sp. ME78]
MNSNSYESQPIKALELLSAITIGNATIDDLIIELRNKKLNFQYPELQKKIRQKLFHKLFKEFHRYHFLNGKIYNPEDITYFNGQELHFVLSTSGDYMLAVDNRRLFKIWLRLAFNEIFGCNNSPYELTELRPFLFPDMLDPLTFTPKTYFYEHIDYNGDYLSLSPNRGYKNLTNVRMSIFEDWNDKISSFQMNNTRVTTLYEHINWEGQTLTMFGSVSNLRIYGWNDRASSIATW